MTEERIRLVALSVYPFSRGFAFVLFERDARLFDWGVREIRAKHKNTKTLEALRAVIDHYRPQALILEDTGSKPWRRTGRIRRLNRSLMRFAASAGIRVFPYSQLQVRDCFAPVSVASKYDLAKAITLRIPGFGHRMPRRRKAWMAHDSRTSLFDAAALGLTYFSVDGRRRTTRPRGRPSGGRGCSVRRRA